MSSKPLLPSILSAHGGIDQWIHTKQISINLHFHGFILEAKGYPGARDVNVTIDPHAPAPNVLLTGLNGDPSNRWIFRRDHVRIESSDGTVLQERDNPREAFKDHVRYPPTPWDQLHLLYFAGYAIWNYLRCPWEFAKEEFSTREVENHHERGEVWRVLEVTYPDGYPAHSKVQRYYWGSEDFLLRRIDYDAEVVKGVAAHYTFDYKRYGGLVFPTFRRVITRIEGEERRVLVSGRTAFALQYNSVEVTNDQAQTYNKGEWVDAQPR